VLMTETGTERIQKQKENSTRIKKKNRRASSTCARPGGKAREQGGLAGGTGHDRWDIRKKEQSRVYRKESKKRASKQSRKSSGGLDSKGVHAHKTRSEGEKPQRKKRKRG